MPFELSWKYGHDFFQELEDNNKKALLKKWNREGSRKNIFFIKPIFTNGYTRHCFIL